ncbi:MAG: hypothetical protein WCV00_07950 [Verrucomicrobiia bacterium]|jgi:hypothetical protein
MIKGNLFLWLLLVAMAFTTIGCDEPYVEKRVIREGPVVHQQEVVR